MLILLGAHVLYPYKWMHKDVINFNFNVFNDYNNSNFTSLCRDFNTTYAYKLVMKQKQSMKERKATR